MSGPEASAKKQSKKRKRRSEKKSQKSEGGKASSEQLPPSQAAEGTGLLTEASREPPDHEILEQESYSRERLQVEPMMTPPTAPIARAPAGDVPTRQPHSSKRKRTTKTSAKDIATAQPPLLHGSLFGEASVVGAVTEVTALGEASVLRASTKGHTNGRATGSESKTTEEQGHDELLDQPSASAAQPTTDDTKADEDSHAGPIPKDTSSLKSEADTVNILGLEPLPPDSNQPEPIKTTSDLMKAPHISTLWKEKGLKFSLAILYHFYLAAGIFNTWSRTPTWCHNIKFLTALTIAAYVFLALSAAVRRWMIAPYEKKMLQSRGHEKAAVQTSNLEAPTSTIRKAFYLAVMILCCSLLLLDALDDPLRLQSLGGLLTLLFVGYLFSYNRDIIPWVQVLCCILLQYSVGALVLRWKAGHAVLNCVSQKVTTFLEFPREGSHFVFGYLTTGINMTQILGSIAEGHNVTDVKPAFVFNTISVMFYISFFVNILYYYGLMQGLIIRIAVILRATTGTTACESMSAVANIFLGMIEAPLMICPYLPTLTKSELHSIMAGGFANIAGTILAAYINFGLDASHLLIASLMSAPAALAYSKILYPETEEIQITEDDVLPTKGKEHSALEAASRAAVITLFMMGSIAANIVAFLAFLAFMNQILQWLLANVDLRPLTFEELLGIGFTPLAMMMGVPWNDCASVGQLIGIKIFANEFIAYLRLTRIKEELHERSVVIATYALCGFGNLGSIGIMLGGLGVLCPSRMEDITQLVFRAMWAGSIASFMTACVAGSLVL